MIFVCLDDLTSYNCSDGTPGGQSVKASSVGIRLEPRAVATQQEGALCLSWGSSCALVPPLHLAPGIPAGCGAQGTLQPSVSLQSIPSEGPPPPPQPGVRHVSRCPSPRPSAVQCDSRCITCQAQRPAIHRERLLLHGAEATLSPLGCLGPGGHVQGAHRPLWGSLSQRPGPAADDSQGGS